MKYILPLILFFGIVCCTSCSTTSQIPDGERLYTGLKNISYDDYEHNKHAEETKEEVEAALAAAPNGSLFGSSFYRTPFPFRLWIWNAFSGGESGFSKWVTKSFGKAPVLMSQVNPQLRSSVAKEVLREHGYFRSDVQFSEQAMTDPKKGKLSYSINMGHLFTYDTIRYQNFPVEADSLIQQSRSSSLLKSGDGFDVSALDAERSRVSTLLRNHGYYYFQPAYSSYLADTLAEEGKVQLQLQMASDVPQQALHKWYIGNVDIELRDNMREQLSQTDKRRFFTLHYNGKHSPLRPRVLMRDLRLRPNRLYSYENHQQSVNKLAASGIFSMVNFEFTPRDTSAVCDTMDLRVNCMFDKPYDFYIETNVKGKTTGRIGPGIEVGLTKRNAFRGGEKLNLSVWGNYEWQTGNKQNNTSSKINSYEYGLSSSLEFPRLVLPGFRFRRRWTTPPSTLLKADFNVVNRAGFFKRHVISGEWTYRFQPTATSMHEFSPLTLEYDYMHSSTEEFRQLRQENTYLDISMRDQFIPKMRYTYIYTSPQTQRHPIYWQTSISEAGNIMSLGYLAAGHNWEEKEKTMFKNAYAQFVKLETDFRKTWSLTEKSHFVLHANMGLLFSYGNSSAAPYIEQFYVGGANSIRAFTIRSLGPGTYVAPNTKLAYMDQTGDMKLLANMEYRFPLFGSLNGALFLDAGNVWVLHDSDHREGSKFQFGHLPKETATATGFGLRYDFDYFVIRVDWGFGLHLPYDTGQKGYFNIPSFHDAQSIHLAIGYPF